MSLVKPLKPSPLKLSPDKSYSLEVSPLKVSPLTVSTRQLSSLKFPPLKFSPLKLYPHQVLVRLRCFKLATTGTSARPWSAALELEPGNKVAKKAWKEVGISIQLHGDSDSDSD